MTHEEMAQRIGASRETVTRLLSDLKKKQLIRLEGATLVIRDRTALEALAVVALPPRRTEAGFALVLRAFLHAAPPASFGGANGLDLEMYSGTLIADLVGIVDRALSRTKLMNKRHADANAVTARSRTLSMLPVHATTVSEPEQFPQSLGLCAADRNLSLLLVVHAQLVRALEPRHDFADAVDIHQVGAVRPPEKIRV